MTQRRRRPAPTRARGAVLCGLTVVGLALSGCESDEVPVDSPTPAAAARARCERLVDALPDTLAGELRRSVDPDDGFTAAWGDPAIVLVCGVPKPAGLDRFAACQEADGVGWFVPDEQLSDQSRDVEMTTVGMRPSVSVLLPASYRPEGAAAAMVDLAPALKDTLRLVHPCV